VAESLFNKLWNSHLVLEETAEAPAIVYIDLHLTHEVTSPQAFDVLRSRGLKVRRPERTFGTIDHIVPTISDKLMALPTVDPRANDLVQRFHRAAESHGIELFGIGDPRRGIVHVIGPELGLTQPGATIVCGDSHTSTHGAFGAWAFGIGTTQVGHVMATQSLLQRKPRTYAVHFEGLRAPAVSAKDMALSMTRALGIGGATGHVIEYLGRGVSALTMEERMTLCNMSIEAGARAGMVAPDDTTFEYLSGRPMAPQGDDWDRALTRWRELPSDSGASYGREISIDLSVVEPMITYGTNPGMAIGVTEAVPDDGSSGSRSALEYMGLRPGEPLLGKPIDVVFVGSCTNARLSDLAAAAEILRGRKVADKVLMLAVPGSEEVKRDAEALGLDKVFRSAGAEWREPGCSMCIAMNGDHLPPGKYAVSTSNRNFEGRQGIGSRTFLASPQTAAASAVAGAVADPRALIEN